MAQAINSLADAPPAMPSPRNTPRALRSCVSPVVCLLLFGASLFLIGSILSLLVKPWLNLSWWRIFRRCVSVASAASLWLIITKRERRTIRSYGLWWTKAGRRQLVSGLLLGCVTLALLFGIGFATGHYHLTITPDRQKLFTVLLGFLPAALLVGFLEELVFRGFVFQHLLSYSSPIALIVSSALYSLVHFKGGDMSLSVSLREFGGLFLLGVVLAISYLRTRQLYLAIGLHAALAYGARVNKLLVEMSGSSLTWWFGNSRLVTGLLGWAALLGIGAVVLWWTRSPHRGGLYDENA